VLACFIYTKITKEIIAKLDKLKFIATLSTGFDHIDLKECKKREILVSNVPVYGSNTVAEHTFALLLTISRNIQKAYSRAIEGNFSIDSLMGFDLYGKTIGIVGTGNIGINVARIAKGFGMNILAYDVFKKENLSKEIGFEYVEYLELLEKSDIITFHLPYNEQTHHILNQENIKKIKTGAIIINTARGALIDTKALLSELNSGRIGGCGLDVLEGEIEIKDDVAVLSENYPLEKMKTVVLNNMLLKNRSIVVTPHIAFYSKEAIARIIDTTLKNIKSFIKNSPMNLVQ
jgi:D-lactate dehydrogenase